MIGESTRAELKVGRGEFSRLALRRESSLFCSLSEVDTLEFEGESRYVCALIGPHVWAPDFGLPTLCASMRGLPCVGSIRLRE